jgi:hypothetical protein
MKERKTERNEPLYKTAIFYRDMIRELKEKKDDKFTLSQLYLKTGEFIRADILWGKSPFDIVKLFKENLDENNLFFWEIDIEETDNPEKWEGIAYQWRNIIFNCKRRIREDEVSREFLLKTIIEISAIIDFLSRGADYIKVEKE